VVQPTSENGSKIYQVNCKSLTLTLVD